MNNRYESKIQKLATSTAGLWMFGVFALAGAAFTGTLPVAIPLFSLENELWRSDENPHTLRHLFFLISIGAASIFAAKSSNLVRLGTAIVALAVGADYALNITEIFHA